MPLKTSLSLRHLMVPLFQRFLTKASVRVFCRKPNFYQHIAQVHILHRSAHRLIGQNEEEVLDVHYIRERLDDENVGKQYAWLELKQQYNFDDAEVDEILSRQARLSKVSQLQLRNTLLFFKNHGLSADKIYWKPELLLIPKDKLEAMASKINKVPGMPAISVFYPLFLLSWQKIEDLVFIWSCEKIDEYPTRAHYFSHILECSLEDTFFMCVRFPFLIKHRFAHVHSVLSLLVEHDVPISSVRRDMWIVRHSTDVIRHRLHLAKEYGVLVRPWQLRCPEDRFFLSLKKTKDDEEALGSHEDKVSYLCHRLGADEEQVRFLIEKTPILNHVRVVRIKAMLDLLEDEGFSANQILNAPRILSYKLETVKKRLDGFKSVGFKPHSLLSLCISEIQHEKLLNLIRKKQHEHRVISV